MSQTHMWIDEVDFWARPFQSEPTVASEVARFYYSLPTSNSRTWGVEQESRKDALRRELKNRRKKEMENCQHGRQSFPIMWQEGVHPNDRRNPLPRRERPRPAFF